ncbi:collectin-10-like [Branchiostoma lanceolatum]|uniref:collectin-10-like n=1 Tax=Branchiostoma lanceolatum TaxID=7740 RepID=UPI003455FBE0
MWRGICYKVFTIKKSFSHAAATCGEDGGTPAMPRDAETNAFLVSLYNSVGDNDSLFWIGLRRQGGDEWTRDGSFEWVDGSALGDYNSWAPGQPYHDDCAVPSPFEWYSAECNNKIYFICQVAPARG